MAVMKLYAGTSTPLTLLPSPVSVQITHEQIWSEDTGRAQSGANQAEMIGTSVAEKLTDNIKWGVLDSTDVSTITSKMPKGFFYFGESASSTTKYYRSEITYDIVQADDVYYKDVSVSVIQK